MKLRGKMMRKMKIIDFFKILMIFCIFSISFSEVKGVVVDRIFTNDRYNVPQNLPTNPPINPDDGNANMPRVITRVIPVNVNENGVFLRRNNVIVGIQKISYIRIKENSESNKYDVECFTSDGGNVVLDSFNSEREAKLYFDDIIRYMRNKGIDVDDR